MSSKANNELAATMKSMTNEELRTALADRDRMIKNLNSTVESLSLANEEGLKEKKSLEEEAKAKIDELASTFKTMFEDTVKKLKFGNEPDKKKERPKKKGGNDKNSPSRKKQTDDASEKFYDVSGDEVSGGENGNEERLSEDDHSSSDSDSGESSDGESLQMDSSSADDDAVVDRKDRVKMNLPTPFKGTRSADAVEVFISQLKSYCYLTAVPKDARVILFKSLLVGTAKKWWKSIAKSKRSKMGFSDALAALHREFHPELQTENARETLDRLKYYPGKFRQFKDMFRNVTFEIKDMSESEKLHVFKKKLPSDFQFEILKLRCKTVKKAMKIASELDFTQRQAGMHDIKKTTNYDRSKKNTSEKDVALGNVKVTPTSDKKKWVNELKALDKDVLQKRRAEGLCLNCGEPNHRISGCPGPHRRQ